LTGKNKIGRKLKKQQGKQPPMLKLRRRNRKRLIRKPKRRLTRR
jgi:hypothetical protein